MHTSSRIVLMTWLLATAAALLGTVEFSRWQRAPDPRHLHEAVLGQWRALCEGDYESAYQQTVSHIRERFSADEYARQAREQFRIIPPDYRIEFGPAAIEGDRALLRVLFVRDGAAAVGCEYQLEREAGAWRIVRARITPSTADRRPPGTRT